MWVSTGSAGIPKACTITTLAVDPGFLQLPEQLIAALDLNDELIVDMAALRQFDGDSNPAFTG